MMNTEWGDICEGTPIGLHSFDLTEQANERYWASAGITHRVFRDGAAYPPIAANATVLAWLDTCAIPMIQTRQRLECHTAARCPVSLTTTGRVSARFVRRGRTYITVETAIEAGGTKLWTSSVDFTPTEALANPATNTNNVSRPIPDRLDGSSKTFEITEERIRQYSRRGNYHSDATTAAALGLPGLVAQGTQVCGPAIDLLAAEWGDKFVSGGITELQFIGMVTAGEMVEALIEIAGSNARLQVWNLSKNRLAAIGIASIG